MKMDKGSIDLFIAKFTKGQKFFTAVTKPEKFSNSAMGDIWSWHKTKEQAQNKVSAMRSTVRAYEIVNSQGETKAITRAVI